MKNILNLIALFFIVLTSYGQNFSLKGNIVDESNTPIPFSNIILKKDSLFVKGSTSDTNGYFEFTNVKSNNYRIIISSVGYKTFSNIVNISKNTLLKTIVLNDIEDLEEVVLTSKKPVVSQQKDRLVFNIEKTILSDKNTWDIINNTPSVFVNQDVITINNTVATLYLNDKKLHLKQNQIKSFLEGLKGKDIKSIEVISNPSAKYDASSGAILNIVTNKKQSIGYKGSVNGEFKRSLNNKYSFGTNHYYTTKKIDFFTNYTFNSVEENTKMDEYINYLNDDNTLKSKWLSFYDLDYKYNTHDLLFNVDYKINEANKISLSTNGFIQPNKTVENNTVGSVFNNDKELTNKYIASSPAINDNYNYSVTLNYSKVLNKKGESISTEITYNTYDNTDEQEINTDYYSANNIFESSNKFKVNSNQNIKIYIAKLDYSVPLRDKVNLEIGAKSSFIKTKSYNNQFNKVGNDYIFNQINSDNYNYDETNYAIYSSVNKEWDKWYAQFGLRGEQTITLGNSLRLNKITDDSYFKLFPSVFLNYYPNQSNVFVFNYSKRIERPKFKQINPFKSYFSDFAVNIGNPNLKPAISHKTDLTYIFKGKHRFNLFYNFQKNKSEELSFQDNDNEVLQFVIVDLKNKINTGFNYYSNLPITKRWVLTSSFTFYYKQNDFYLIDSPKTIKTNSIWREVIQLTNNFIFLKDKSFTSSLRYVYASPTITGSYTQNERNFVVIDFKKKILNKKGTISLSLGDIFNTDNFDFTSKYGNQDNGYFQKNESQQIKVGFIYNFGDKKLKANDKTKSSSETKRVDD